jgi:LuxR family maltose regulon positive regulatory protein
MANLQVRQQMTEIRTAELRFSLDETQTYLEQVLGESLSREIVTLLEKRTEGWIAGLRLAALSMRGQEDYTAFVKGFKGVSREVAAYLTEEVLTGQSQLTQDFLLRTSLLDRFCVPLCAAVTGKSGNSCRSILESLMQTNLFIVPLDYEQKWYRYHHLFQGLLRRKVQAQLSGDEIVALHSKANAWLASNGLIEEALHHALVAGDMERAAQLVEDSRHDLLNQEDWATLQRCLNRLPEQVIRRRPALLVARAWALELQYQIAGIPPLLQEAEARLKADAAGSEPEPRDLRGEIDALWSLVLYLGNEGQRALDSALRAVERIPVTNAFARSFAVLILALAYQMTGQVKTALRTLNEFLAEIGTQPDTIIARMLIGQIYVNMLAGNLHQAEQVLHQLEQVASKTRLAISLVVVHWLLGRLNYEWNSLETASQHCTAVFELRYGGQFIMVHDSMMALALVYQRQGMKEKREETLATLRSFSLEIGNTEKLHEIDSFEARLALLQGNLQQAIRWADTVHLEIRIGTIFFLEYPIVTKAKALIAKRTGASLREATESLQKLLAYVRSKHNNFRQIEILALLALAHQAQGRTDDALDSLEHSIELAQPGGFIRTYVDLGPEMAGLLYQLADRGVAPGYIGPILAAFLETPVGDGTALMIRQAAQAEMIEPLTERESEVLMLLAKEMPNKVIARTLNISSLTVKRHTVNIYQKLSAHSRKQAVARARALGILSSDGKQ